MDTLGGDMRRATALAPSYGVITEDAPLPPRDDPQGSRVYFSTIMALVLAILGSSTLPLAYAFVHTGVLMGLLLAFVRPPTQRNA